MKIDLSCPNCGSHRFDYPLKFTNTSVITCAACRQNVGTVAELREQVIQELESRKI